MAKRLIIALVLALATTGCLWALWTRDVSGHPRVFNGPMVQRVTPEGFTVTWELDPDHPAEVTVLDEKGLEIGSVPAERIKDPMTCDLTRWSAIVHGLKPGLVYHYRIAVDSPTGQGSVVSEHTVRTAAEPGQPFRFLALGDTGTGKSAQYRIARRLGNWKPDLILHAGDLITPQAERGAFPAKFFRPYADLLASVPMYVCLGNHDTRVEQGQPMLDTFILPANGPSGEDIGRHYWFDWGDARFVVVDSNHDYPYFRDVVAPWFDQVLADAGERWTIAVWHEPVVTHGDKYPPAKKLLLSLVPVLDRHRCTLVFSGHQHMYERSRPIRAGRCVEANEGTVYITSAAGGCNLYNQLKPNSPAIAAFCDTQHSFTVVDVLPDRLAIRQIGDTGNLIDHHQIEKPVK